MTESTPSPALVTPTHQESTTTTHSSQPAQAPYSLRTIAVLILGIMIGVGISATVYVVISGIETSKKQQMRTSITEAVSQQEKVAEQKTPQPTSDNSLQNTSTVVSFWYPQDRYMTLLQEFESPGQQKMYGVFKTKESLESCVKYMEQQRVSFDARQFGETDMSCLRDTYTVTLHTQTENRLEKDQFSVQYTDRQGRLWKVQEIEVQGFYRVIGILQGQDTNHVVTLQSWGPNGTQVELLELAHQTFDNK